MSLLAALSAVWFSILSLSAGFTAWKRWVQFVCAFACRWVWISIWFCPRFSPWQSDLVLSTISNEAHFTRLCALKSTKKFVRVKCSLHVMVGIGWFCHFLLFWVPFDSPVCHFLRVLLPENVEFSFSVRLLVFGCGFFSSCLVLEWFFGRWVLKMVNLIFFACDGRVEVSFGWFWLHFPMKCSFLRGAFNGLHQRRDR